MRRSQRRREAVCWNSVFICLICFLVLVVAIAVVICCYRCLCWNNEWAQTSMRFQVDLLCWPAVNFSRLEKGCLRHCSQPFLFCRGMIDRWNMHIVMICIAVTGSQWKCGVTSPDFSSDLCFILWSDSGWVFQGWRLSVQRKSKERE